MAGKRGSTSSKGNQSGDPNLEKDILTLSGYTRIFGTYENNSDIFECLSKILNEVQVDCWRHYLNERKVSKTMDHLLSYWQDYDEHRDFDDVDKLIYFAELFSLAENVLRNVLLYPYIPAYRTINMNSGRYINSESKDGNDLFQRLRFKRNSKNLLTYQEVDQTIIILEALTCYVFWNDVLQRLKHKRGIAV